MPEAQPAEPVVQGLGPGIRGRLARGVATGAAPLKQSGGRADVWGAMRDLACPICNADVPLTGDEKPGEEIYCPYCRAPLSLTGSSEEEYELQDET